MSVEKWMADLREVARLRELGLLTNDEFEEARREIFLGRSGTIASDPSSEISEPSLGEPTGPAPAVEPEEDADGHISADPPPNWWQASDGMWYPPEALNSLVEAGWWQADDGNWYQSEERGQTHPPPNDSESVQGRRESPSDSSHKFQPAAEEFSLERFLGHVPADRPSEPAPQPVQTPSAPRPRGRRRRRGLVVLVGTALIVGAAYLGIFGERQATLPDAMEPVSVAILGQTFAPWQEANSAFVSGLGLKKWLALSEYYRASFAQGEVAEKELLGITHDNDWYIIEYCSVRYCGTDSVYQLHLRSGNEGKISDLRFLRGKKKDLDEVSIYEVRLDPSYEFDDPQGYFDDNVMAALRPGLDIDYAIQWNEGCLFGRFITPRGFINGEVEYRGITTSSVLKWRIFLNLGPYISTRDGLQLEPTYDGHPTIVEVTESGDVPVKICVDYPVSEVTEYVIPGGDWDLEKDDGRSYSYTEDFVVPFTVVEL
ncbi:hypothetical protein N9E02_01225 [Ilumatobacteraceae bacterium]|nr:hypothetical protein [Ilumatobacteraceae bacterium]